MFQLFGGLGGSTNQSGTNIAASNGVKRSLGGGGTGGCYYDDNYSYGGNATSYSRRFWRWRYNK